VFYRADDRVIDLANPVRYQGKCTFGLRWQPGVAMPAWACRLSLLITDIRVHPLHEITEHDLRTEGVANLESYRALCDGVHSPFRWNKNPFVIALDFKVDHHAPPTSLPLARPMEHHLMTTPPPVPATSANEPHHTRL
jgi:hypothetical protein